MGSAKRNAPHPRRAGSPTHPPQTAIPRPQPLTVIAPAAYHCIRQERNET
jgi:hypothetical protein